MCAPASNGGNSPPSTGRSSTLTIPSASCRICWTNACRMLIARSARGCLDLVLRHRAQHAPQAHEADVVLVQVLALVGIELHLFQHHAVLLQHRPVACLEPVAIEEAPRI